MHVLICNSNMFIPVVLTTILKRPKQKYLIYVDIPSIYTFFQELNLSHNVSLLKYPYYVNWKYSAKAKKEVFEQFQSVKVESITFYHTEYGELATWLISQYSKSISIYFEPPFPSFNFKKSYSIKAISLYLIYKLIYNTDIIPMDCGNYIMPSISARFFKKNNVIIRDAIVDEDLVYNYVNEKLTIKKGKQSILLVTGSNIAAGFCNKDDYEKVISSIILALGKDQIMVKCHPRYDDLLEIERSLPSIMNYIPGNVILPLFDCCIGVCSTLLNEAANLGKCSISLLDMLEIDSKMKLVLKHALDTKEMNGTHILYPADITELVRIIKGFSFNHSTSFCR